MGSLEELILTKYQKVLYSHGHGTGMKAIHSITIHQRWKNNCDINGEPLYFRVSGEAQYRVLWKSLTLICWRSQAHR